MLTAGQSIGVNLTYASLNAAAKAASRAVFLALRDTALKSAQHGATQEAVQLAGKGLARRFIQVVDQNIAKAGFSYLGKPARDIFVSVAQRELRIIENLMYSSKLVKWSNAKLLLNTIEAELELLLL